MIVLTAFGALFAGLVAAILLLRPRWLAALLPLAAVMQAPAVVVLVLGSQRLGVTPFNAMAAVAGAVLLQRMRRDRHAARRAIHGALHSRWPFFLLYAALAALVLPFWSAGVPVHPLLAEGDVNPAMPLPNAPSLSHVAQAINSAGLLVILLWLYSDADVRGQVRALAAGVMAALAASFALGLYQRGAMLGAWPLASAFWGSNPGYNQWFLVPDYGPYFGRAALPFIEPSYASVWFAACACGAFAVAVHARRRWLAAAAAAFLAALLGLANTVGTSGFVALGGFGVVFLLHFAWRGWRTAPPHGRWIVAGATALALAAIALVLADYLALHTAALAPVRAALDFTLFKTRDFSSNVRVLADLRALGIFVETWGLGAGPGSTRASGYLVALLANAGLAGVVLFVAALARTLATPYALAMHGHASACLALGAACGVLAGVLPAISDQNWPVLWALLFFAACCARALSVPAGPAPVGAPPPRA